MKNINSFFLAFMLMFASANVNAQSCSGTTISFNENDFPAVAVQADNTTTTSTALSSEIDIATGDATNGWLSGPDGTNDVSITLQAFVSTPNACADDNFQIGGAIGTGGALGGSSDFAVSTNNSCLCQSGYVVATIDFINGFYSTADGFNLDFSSVNGGSEGYEFMYGYVSGVGGATFNAGVDPALISSYCNAEYDAATDIAAHVGATGAGVFGAYDFNTNTELVPFPGDVTGTLFEDPNATAPPGGPYTAQGSSICGQTDDNNGEDSASGQGANSTSDAVTTGGANIGLAATDQITQITIVYGLSTAPGKDCDGDFDQGVDTSPSASWSNVSVCVPSPSVACGTCTEGAAGLVVTELTYDPSTAQGSDSSCEYVELFNSYSNTITLDANTTLALSNGASFTFPAGTTIASGEYIIIAINPTNFGTCTWGTPPPVGTQIFGPTSGSLSNSGESITITLACALDATQDFTQTVAFSDGATPGAGGGGNSVYYPLDGTGPLEAAPSPGSGDCAACASTEFTCAANCSIAGTLNITEACGVLTIEVTGITENMTSGTGFILDLLDDGASIETSATIASGTTTHTFTVTPAADGSSVFTVTITDAGDAACTSTAGPVTSPPSTAANVPTFVPNGPTTTTP